MAKVKATVTCSYCKTTEPVKNDRRVTHQGVAGYAVMPFHGRGEFGCIGSYALMMPVEGFVA